MEDDTVGSIAYGGTQTVHPLLLEGALDSLYGAPEIKLDITNRFYLEKEIHPPITQRKSGTRSDGWCTIGSHSRCDT